MFSNEESVKRSKTNENVGSIVASDNVLRRINGRENSATKDISF